jgi:hypothetical protein
MHISFQNIIIAAIYFLAGIYALLTGIFALTRLDVKIPGFYQFGVFISKKVHRKDKLTSFENDMMDRKKVIRYGIFWIFIGVIALAGGIFLLFAS